MGDDSLNRFRLSLMQDILPVGLAMAERVRRGGPNQILETFASSQDPFQELRVEGETAAKDLREKLDQVSPGLGNPVVEVDIAVDNPEIQDEAALKQLLGDIEDRLDILQKLLDGESVEGLLLEETD